MYGYHSNAEKTFLIVKEELKPAAASMFSDTGFKITTDGHKFLSCLLGAMEVSDEFCENLGAKFYHMTNVLSDIAKSYSHEAYTDYTFGMRNRWSYFCRSVPEMESRLIMKTRMVCFSNEYFASITETNHDYSVNEDPHTHGDLSLIISADEISNELSVLDPYKSRGEEKLPASVMKETANKLKTSLFNIFKKKSKD